MKKIARVINALSALPILANYEDGSATMQCACHFPDSISGGWGATSSETITIHLTIRKCKIADIGWDGLVMSSYAALKNAVEGDEDEN